VEASVLHCGLRLAGEVAAASEFAADVAVATVAATCTAIFAAVVARWR
jgi:hypothetical protein